MDRIIFLVDMNAFFISCETTRHPDLAGCPAAVAGDPKRRAGIILSANYKARAYGVQTAMTLHEALRLCPDMRLVPPDHHFYEQKSEEVMRFLSGFTPLLEQNSIDEAWLDMTGCEDLYGSPTEAAQKIMDGIQNQLGLWCSIGIAPNKFLAKMASELKKPMGITKLTQEDVPSRIWPLPVGALHGVGTKTAMRLSGMGIRTIGDLARLDETFLVRQFGKYGYELHRHAHGIDNEPVIPHETREVKSIGRSTTLALDLTDLDEARKVMLALTDEVATDARRKGKKGSTVQITLKYSDFKVITRQMQIRATDVTKDLYAAACHLLESCWDVQKPVRLLGFSISGFLPVLEQEQISIFDLLDQESAEEQRPQKEMLDKAIDSIRTRFGSHYVTYGKLLNGSSKETEDKKPDR